MELWVVLNAGNCSWTSPDIGLRITINSYHSIGEDHESVAHMHRVVADVVVAGNQDRSRKTLGPGNIEIKIICTKFLYFWILVLLLQL